VSEIYDYDISPSGKDWIFKGVYYTEESIVFMFSRQTDRYLPSREATGPLFPAGLRFDWLGFF